MNDKRTVTYEVEYCNSRCPHFYHNYYDGENIWCDLLGKMIYSYNNELPFRDLKMREIPKECPLPRSKK